MWFCAIWTWWFSKYREKLFTRDRYKMLSLIRPFVRAMNLTGPVLTTPARAQLLLRPPASADWWRKSPAQPQIPTIRYFHAANSKVKYLDFRHKFRTNHLKLHLINIRRQKMKKHKKIKWRKKFKCLLAKQRLKREIAKEKIFRVELLTAIRDAENFDPREYAMKKLSEIYNKPREMSREESLEHLKQLIRENRYQVTYIKPKHKRADI